MKAFITLLIMILFSTVSYSHGDSLAKADPIIKKHFSRYKTLGKDVFAYQERQYETISEDLEKAQTKSYVFFVKVFAKDDDMIYCGLPTKQDFKDIFILIDSSVVKPIVKKVRNGDWIYTVGKLKIKNKAMYIEPMYGYAYNSNNITEFGIKKYKR